MNEPDYYVKNGLSPIGAFRKGLLGDDEYRGFLIGNVIKYVVRAGKKDDAIRDLEKAKHYLDFYIEYCRKHIEHSHEVEVQLNVGADLDMEKFKKEIMEAMKEANAPQLMMVPTDEPNIAEIKLSEAMYDENGDLKPEVREKINDYINENRLKHDRTVV